MENSRTHQRSTKREIVQFCKSLGYTLTGSSDEGQGHRPGTRLYFDKPGAATIMPTKVSGVWLVFI